MKAFVCLGKFGDVLSALPIAQDWQRQTGEVPAFIVARQYASVVEDAQFVKTVIWDGHWTEILEALTQTKKEFNDVTCLQLFGKDFNAQQNRSSFQLEQYERGGVLEKWNELPLVMDSQTNQMPSWFDRAKKSKYILFCDHSQSSPFPHKDALQADLENFGYFFEPFTLSIVPSSRLMLPRLSHLLPVMDFAQAVVCVESAPLHLSRATTTPVVALATDKPSRWHGSAWSERFAFYCRYSEYPERAKEMIEAISDAILKKQKHRTVVLN